MSRDGKNSDRENGAGYRDRIWKCMGCLFWVALGIVFLAGMKKVGLGPKKTVAMGLIVAAAVGIHIRRMQRTPGYIRKIFGLEAGRGGHVRGGTDAKGGADAEGGIDAKGGADAEGGTDAEGGADAEGGTDVKGGTDAEGGTDVKGGADAKGGTDAEGGAGAGYGSGRGPGSGSGKKRIYEYDWLRSMAVVMVIVTHAVQMDMASGMVPEGIASYAMTVLYVFCLACNLLYVMLSGALLLPYKEEKLSDLYLHRLAKVALPMLVYFVFYLWIDGELEQIGLHEAGEILNRFFRGDTPESPHYWLMYVILGLYVVFPFFRYMFKDMPYKVLTAMVLTSGICMYLATYSPIPCAVDPLLSSWIGVAVTGYWVTRKETRQYDKRIMAAGLAGLLITMYCIKTREDFLAVCCNCSPTMLMIAAGLFSLVFSVPKLFSKGNVVLSVLGRYSFSLILIHWIVLFFSTRVVFEIYTSQYLYIGGILLSLSVTLFASFVVAFLIDNLVVVVAEAVYDLAVVGGKWLVGRGKKAWRREGNALR